MFSASSFVALYCSPPSIINTLAFLSCFSVLVFVTTCLNFTAQLYSSLTTSTDHTLSSLCCFCTNRAFCSCDLYPHLVLSFGLVYCMVYSFCVFVVLLFVIRVRLSLLFALQNIPKEDTFFLFCFCICYQWHIVRNLSYRSILIEFCVNAFSFFFSFFCSIKLMDSHGFFSPLSVAAPIKWNFCVIKIFVVQKKGSCICCFVFFHLSLLFFCWNFASILNSFLFPFWVFLLVVLLLGCPLSARLFTNWPKRICRNVFCVCVTVCWCECVCVCV